MQNIKSDMKLFILILFPLNFLDQWYKTCLSPQQLESDTRKHQKKQQSKGNFKWFKFNQSRRRVFKEKDEKIEKNSSTSSSSAEFINSNDSSFVFSISSSTLANAVC